jgi:hypothetical protein
LKNKTGRFLDTGKTMNNVQKHNICGNNGANRMLYYDIAAETITELPRVSLLEPGIPHCRPPWVFSKLKLFLMQGTA